MMVSPWFFLLPASDPAPATVHHVAFQTQPRLRGLFQTPLAAHPAAVALYAPSTAQPGPLREPRTSRVRCVQFLTVQVAGRQAGGTEEPRVLCPRGSGRVLPGRFHRFPLSFLPPVLGLIAARTPSFGESSLTWAWRSEEPPKPGTS